jgi:hypothetical protein
MPAQQSPWIGRLTHSDRKHGAISLVPPIGPRRPPSPEVTADRSPGVGRTTHFDTPITKSALDGHLVQAAFAALDSLTVLESHAKAIGRRFRTGAVAEGQRGLIQLVRGVGMLLVVAATTAHAAGPDFTEAYDQGGRRVDTDTSAALDDLIRYQMRGDWQALASTLDQAFASALSGWRAVFEALLGSPSGPGPFSLAA